MPIKKLCECGAKVLPTVYDDVLSYEEQIGKLKITIAGIIKDIEKIENKLPEIDNKLDKQVHISQYETYAYTVEDVGNHSTGIVPKQGIKVIQHISPYPLSIVERNEKGQIVANDGDSDNTVATCKQLKLKRDIIDSTTRNDLADAYVAKYNPSTRKVEQTKKVISHFVFPGAIASYDDEGHLHTSDPGPDNDNPDLCVNMGTLADSLDGKRDIVPLPTSGTRFYIANASGQSYAEGTTAASKKFDVVQRTDNAQIKAPNQILFPPLDDEYICSSYADARYAKRNDGVPVIKMEDFPVGATNGKVPYYLKNAIITYPNIIILFEKEYYHCEAAGHQEGYNTYVHLGYENGTFNAKAITVNVNDWTWVLNTGTNTTA